MADLRILFALAGPAREGEPNPMASLVMMGLIFAVFYFVLILPMRRKQKKLEGLVQQLKTGDKVVLNSGIFGTIVGLEDLHIRICRLDLLWLRTKMARF